MVKYLNKHKPETWKYFPKNYETKRDIFQAARIPLTEQEVDELIWKLDQDGDGEIDYRYAQQ